MTQRYKVSKCCAQSRVPTDFQFEKKQTTAHYLWSTIKWNTVKQAIPVFIFFPLWNVCSNHLAICKIGLFVFTFELYKLYIFWAQLLCQLSVLWIFSLNLGITCSFYCVFWWISLFLYLLLSSCMVQTWYYLLNKRAESCYSLISFLPLVSNTYWLPTTWQPLFCAFEGTTKSKTTQVS